MKSHVMRNTLIVALIVVVVALGLAGFAPVQTELPPAEPTPVVVETPIAPEPAAGDPLTLPDFVPVLLAAGLGWLVTQGLKSAGAVYPWLPNLEKEAAATVAAIVTTFILVGNAALALVPPELQTPIVLLFSTIGSILSAYGIYDIVKGFQKKAAAKPAG